MRFLAIWASIILGATFIVFVYELLYRWSIQSLGENITAGILAGLCISLTAVIAKILSE